MVIGSVIIAGGGLAGAAAAAGLARSGVKVTLIEREGGPVDKICGEFLSVEAQNYLATLGVDLAALGGHEISRLVVSRKDRSIETELPFKGIGLSRRRLDEAVLNHAQSAGAMIRRGHAIDRVSCGADIVLKLANTEEIRASTLFHATGKHEMRGLRRDSGACPDLVGFKMYFRLTPAAETELAGQIRLTMFGRGYAGLQLVEGRKANLCLLAERSRLQSAGGKWQGILHGLCSESAAMAGLLAGAEPLLGKPLTISRVPYGYIHKSAAADHNQVFRLGDQAGVIPSLTGDGMAIALHSAALAVSCYLSGRSASFYHKQLARDISGQIGRASALYSLAQSHKLQAAAFTFARLWPGSLGMAARLTRVPMRARLSAV